MFKGDAILPRALRKSVRTVTVHANNAYLESQFQGISLRNSFNCLSVLFFMAVIDLKNRSLRLRYPCGSWKVTTNLVFESNTIQVMLNLLLTI